MKVEFFAEYPSDLRNSKKVDWDSKIYFASPKPKNDFTWWPIMKRGYFISYLSPKDDLVELLNAIEHYKPNEVMLDLEVPLKIEIKGTHEKKKILEKILEEADKVTTVEYPYLSNITESMKKKIGLTLESDEKIYICHTSYSPRILSKIFEKAYKRDAKIGVGTIAKGKFGFERIMKPKELKNTLRKLEEYGRDVVIYRLGGLNKEYIEIIKEFI